MRTNLVGAPLNESYPPKDAREHCNLWTAGPQLLLVPEGWEGTLGAELEFSVTLRQRGSLFDPRVL